MQCVEAVGDEIPNLIECLYHIAIPRQNCLLMQVFTIINLWHQGVISSTPVIHSFHRSEISMWTVPHHLSESSKNINLFYHLTTIWSTWLSLWKPETHSCFDVLLTHPSTLTSSPCVTLSHNYNIGLPPLPQHNYFCRYMALLLERKHISFWYISVKLLILSVFLGELSWKRLSFLWIKDNQHIRVLKDSAGVCRSNT